MKTKLLVLFYASIVLASLVTIELIYRYTSGLMPFSHIDWLIIPVFMAYVYWDKRSYVVPGYPVKDLIFSTAYFISFGTFFSMIGFQTIREMDHPGNFVYGPWFMVAMFCYIIIVGPVGNYRNIAK
jgi:hypothetical protein